MYLQVKGKDNDIYMGGHYWVFLYISLDCGISQWNQPAGSL